MGNIGLPEILIVLVIVLVLFGAKRIPEIAGSFGKGITEFKRNLSDAKSQLTDGMNEPPRSIGGASELPRPAARPATPEEEAVRSPKRLIG